MAICVCGGFMKVVGDEFVCGRCGKRKAIIKKIPPQNELWVEVQKLRLESVKYFRLYNKVNDAKTEIKSTHSPEHKLAEIELILEDD